ncbi:hypothetical protein BASA61_006823 [Batrachochytrium salamandrivorans]|nr:hypothetical protein BASA61_006823 [Batrachochytrium salamandrivorans]
MGSRPQQRDETSDMASKARWVQISVGTIQVEFAGDCWRNNLSVTTDFRCVMDRRIHRSRESYASRMVVWTPTRADMPKQLQSH